MRRLGQALALYSALVLGVLCFGQTIGTVKQSTGLQKSYRSPSAVLLTLNTGDSVTLISKTKRSGYYHVIAPDGTTKGWVLASNVTLTSGGAPTSPPAGPTGGGTPSGLLAQLSAARVPGTPQPLVINGQQVCGPEGDAADPKFQALDSEKNRTDTPDANAYIPVNWQSMRDLPSTNVGNYEGAPVAVVGYLSHHINIENSGESTNCHLKNDDEVDWHIYLTNQSNQSIANAIVVETTPRTRPLHSWDYNALSNLVNTNTKVRISGWLMYDFQHIDVIGTERASVWEVHPITRIEIQDQSGNWKDVEQH